MERMVDSVAKFPAIVPRLVARLARSGSVTLEQNFCAAYLLNRLELCEAQGIGTLTVLP